MNITEHRQNHEILGRFGTDKKSQNPSSLQDCRELNITEHSQSHEILGSVGTDKKS